MHNLLGQRFNPRIAGFRKQNLTGKVAASLTLIVMFSCGLQQPARADVIYSTFATTGAFDAGNFFTQGGTDGDVGQATAIAPPALDFGTFNAQLFTSSATASANLGFGELKVFAKSDGPAAAFARAHYSDLITIAPTAGFSDFFQATFTLTVDGTLTGNADGGGELQVASTVEHADVGGTALCSAGATVCSPIPSVAGGSVRQTLVATIYVDPSNPIVFIQPFLFAAANDINGNFLLTESGLADFSDTAQLSISLPEGFTYTSNSGVLLTQVQTSEVPEPVAWPVIGPALLALVYGSWRRRRPGPSVQLP